jgi:hypothetical protein
MMEAPVFFDDNKVFTSLNGEDFKYDHWVVAWIEYKKPTQQGGSPTFGGAVLVKKLQTCYWPETTVNNDYRIVGSPTFGHETDPVPPFSWDPSALGPAKCPCVCDCEGEIWASYQIPIKFSNLLSLASYGGHYWEYMKYIASIETITSEGFDGPIGPNAAPVGDSFRLTESQLDENGNPINNDPIVTYLQQTYPVNSLDAGSSIGVVNSLRELSYQISNIDSFVSTLTARREAAYIDAGFFLEAQAGVEGGCCAPVIDQQFPPFNENAEAVYCFSCDTNQFPHIKHYPDPELGAGQLEATFFVADCDPEGSVVADGVEPFSTYFAMHDTCDNGLVREDSCLLDHLNSCGTGGSLTTVAEYGFTINGQLCGYRTWGELDGDPDQCPCQNTILPSGTTIEFTYTSYCDNNEFVPCDQVCENSTYNEETGAETIPWTADCADPVSFTTDGIQTFGAYFGSASSCANGYDGEIYNLYNLCTSSEWIGVGGAAGIFRLWSVNGSSCWYRPDGAKANGDFDSSCPCMSEILPSGTTLTFIAEGTCNNPEEDLFDEAPDCTVCIQHS